MKWRLLFLLCLLPILFRWLCIPYGNLPQRDSVHGDTVTGRWVISAALFFKDHGFSKSSGLPVFDYQKGKPIDNLVIYGHGMAIPP